MPYPPNHRQETKAKIVLSARRLFNRFGFDGVSIQQIMADAGLTHGGFYKHFASKSDLYAEVMARFFTDPGRNSNREGVSVDMKVADAGGRSFALTCPGRSSRKSIIPVRWSRCRVTSRAGTKKRNRPSTQHSRQWSTYCNAAQSRRTTPVELRRWQSPHCASAAWSLPAPARDMPWRMSCDALRWKSRSSWADGVTIQIRSNRAVAGQTTEPRFIAYMHSIHKRLY